VVSDASQNCQSLPARREGSGFVQIPLKSSWQTAIRWLAGSLRGRLKLVGGALASVAAIGAIAAALPVIGMSGRRSVPT